MKENQNIEIETRSKSLYLQISYQASEIVKVKLL